MTGSTPRPLLASQILDKVAGSLGCLLEKNALLQASGRKVDVDEIRNLIVEHVDGLNAVLAPDAALRETFMPRRRLLKRELQQL